MRSSNILLRIALPLLGCAAIATAPSDAAARGPSVSPTATGRASSHTRSVCQASAAHPASAPHAVKSARACTVRSHKGEPKKTKRRKPRQHRAPAAALAPPAPPPAPAADDLAATIAAVLATPCQNTELQPAAADLALVRAAVLCLINQKRAQNDESPLTLDSQLQQAAEGHGQELVSLDYFAHVSPSGETPVDRIRETGYIPSPSVGYVIGENLAWGTYELSTPQSIVEAWFASPPHLANILEGQYRETGIGVSAAVPPSLADGAPGATYAQEFGVVLE